MRNRCSYAGLVSAYFSVYLAGTKNVSTNTIYSYRDTFVIFHGYLEKYCGFKLEKMLFNDLSRELILEFLQYLETERKCSISSRNQRLAALKSFAKYVQIECPDEMILCQRILSIDSKKAAKPTVQYLSNQQTDILMEQPDISTPKGRRDLAMILLLYDSAARVQELCDLRICDIRIDSLPVVHLLGKGRKSRDVPLTKPCAQVLRQYICENHLDIPERRNDQLFTNPQGKKLTRSGVSYVLAKYSHKANTAVDSFFPQITPHCLRHSKAMHLVEAGKNLIYIRDFLGHESIETTQVYAKANPEARRKALETMDTRMNTPVTNLCHLVAGVCGALDGYAHLVQPGLATKTARIGCQCAAYAFGGVNSFSLVTAVGLNKRTSCCFGERKYFSSTSLIKISDNVHAVS